MSTTVRVDDDVKAELDRLQGLVQMETGQRLSQSELLARLVRYAHRRPEIVLDESKPWTPPTIEQLARLFEKVRDWGVETDVSKIDEVLYEEDSPHGDPP